MVNNVLGMTNERLVLPTIVPSSAQPALPVADPDLAILDDLMARVGVDGLTAAFAQPALLAVLDQHGAAVREALRSAERALDAAGLAAYGRSVVAAANRMGRPVPEVGAAYVTTAQWLDAEWHLLRLVAVCMLAEAADLL